MTTHSISGLAIRQTNLSVRRSAFGVRRSSPAFTLIEMIIVISIISVLLGLLYGSLERARTFSRRTIAYTELKNIESAFKQYHAHYHTWPSNHTANADAQISSDQDQGFVIDFKVANALQGFSTNNEKDPLLVALNPAAIPFIEFNRFIPNPLPGKEKPPINIFSAHYRGPVDNKYRYKVLFDTNGDRQIQIPGNDPDAAGLQITNIIASVAVWTIIPATRQTDSSGQAKTVGDVIFGSWDSFNAQ